jgi:predicted  nucleic acid-binding Zn-ribbon protein
MQNKGEMHMTSGVYGNYGNYTASFNPTGVKPQMENEDKMNAIFKDFVGSKSDVENEFEKIQIDGNSLAKDIQDLEKELYNVQNKSRDNKGYVDQLKQKYGAKNDKDLINKLNDELTIKNTQFRDNQALMDKLRPIYIKCKDSQAKQATSSQMQSEIFNIKYDGKITEEELQELQGKYGTASDEIKGLMTEFKKAKNELQLKSRETLLKEGNEYHYRAKNGTHFYPKTQTSSFFDLDLSGLAKFIGKPGDGARACINGRGIATGQ